MAALAVVTLTWAGRTVTERRLGIIEPEGLRDEMWARERQICGREAVHTGGRRGRMLNVGAFPVIGIMRSGWEKLRERILDV